MAVIGGTIDEADVAHHSHMARDWWNPHGAMRVLRKLNPLRIKFICEGINRNDPQNMKDLKNIKILDAGCGGGFLSEALAFLGADVTGVDASEELIRAATIHASRVSELRENLPTYISSTVEYHATTRMGYYDVVVASEVLEHVRDHDLFLQACVKALRPGGLLFITTPNRTLATWWYVIVWLERVLGEIPRGTHQYRYFSDLENTNRILKKYNCTTLLSKGLGYSHIQRQWTWHSNHWYALKAQKNF